MLFNPQWDNDLETPGALSRLITWLEAQDPKTRYIAENAQICVMAQFLGREVPAQLSSPWAQIAYDFEGNHLPGAYSFGAALSRARKIAGHAQA